MKKSTFDWPEFKGSLQLEISTYLQNATGKVCGRFKTTDINTVHIPQHVSTPTLNIKPKWFAWLTVFAFLGFGKKAEACPPPGTPLFVPSNPNQIHVKKGHTIIKGEIKRSDTKTGIAEVEIKVYSAGKVIAFTKSFVNGTYFLTIPENTIFDFNVDVEYNAVNFASQILRDLPVQKQEITLNTELIQMEELEVINYTMGKFETTQIDEFEIIKQSRENYHTMGAMVMTKYTILDHEILENELKIEVDSIVPTTEVNHDIQINAYPNPTANYITIDIENASQVSIQLFDFTGKMIQYYSSQESRNVLDLSNHPNGTYIVRVIDDATNKMVQKKIIKVY